MFDKKNKVTSFNYNGQNHNFCDAFGDAKPINFITDRDGTEKTNFLEALDLTIAGYYWVNGEKNVYSNNTRYENLKNKIGLDKLNSYGLCKLNQLCAILANREENEILYISYLDCFLEPELQRKAYSLLEFATQEYGIQVFATICDGSELRQLAARDGYLISLSN